MIDDPTVPAPVRAALALALVLLVAGAATPAAADSVLFVRGGPGTGGFLEGGSDEQLSDITNDATFGGNHGWGQLADLLESEGYLLEQVIEGPIDDNQPIDFAALDLSAYDVIVLGSNNAAYPPAAVDAIEDFVRDGGGLLVISDANWGTDWCDAPTSDQPFLDRFGLVMNQDRGTYSICREDGDFVVAGADQGGHPILAPIDCFDGEGVSPITLADDPVAGVRGRILANAEGLVRRNEGSGQGPSTPATDDDGALVVALAGRGRLAGHYDRNTFFNQNGAGTSLVRFDNAAYASRLFAWLAGRLTCPGDVDADGTVGTSDLLALLATWGPGDGGPEDLDGDGAIATSDLLIVLAEWGDCG